MGGKAIVGAALAAAFLLAACGGGDDSSSTSDGTQAAAEETTTVAGSSGSSGTSSAGAGTATITFGGDTQTLTFSLCVSIDDTSVQGAAANDEVALQVDVKEGSGLVQLSRASDMTVTVDGKTEDLRVTKEGDFTASGTYPADGAQQTFTLTGTCGTVSW